MNNTIHCQSGLKRMLTLLLALVLGLAGLFGFATGALAEGDAPIVHLTQGEGYFYTDADGNALGAGDHAAEEGFRFRVAVEEGYSGKRMRVYADGQVLKAHAGIYALEEVQGSVVITVSGVKELPVPQETYFTVTLPKNDEKYTIATLGDPSSVPGGGDFTFTLTPKDAYSGNTPVVTDGTRTLMAASDGGAYTYTLEGVHDNITITVDDHAWARNKYEVILPKGDGYTITDIGGAEETDAGTYSIPHGESLHFRVEVAAGYVEESLDVSANGKPLAATNGVYTLLEVKAHVTVHVAIDKESAAPEKFSLYDEKTKAAVSGQAIGTPWLSAYKLDKGSAAYKTLLARADGLSVLGAYGLHMGGAEIDGRLKVTFTLGKEHNGSKVNIYRLRGNGRVEVHTATVKNGKASVYVNAVSEFLLAGPAQSGAILPPRTGDTRHAQAPLMLVAGALAAAALCARKRKKA